MKMLNLAACLCLVVLGSLGTTPTARADVSIHDIQLGVYNVGTVLTIEDVVVTGVARFGFFIQEPDNHPTHGRKWSGIWVFTNTAPTLAKGDLVDVTGTYEEFFNFSEINTTTPSNPPGSVTVVGEGTIPPSFSALITEVNDTGALAEAYESVLIRVDRSDPTLFANPANQFDEWALSTGPDSAGAWLVMDSYAAQGGGDFEYDIPPNNAAVSFAQGILVYNFNQYKLAPRNCETDLGVACKPVLRGAYSTSATNVNAQFGIDVDEIVAENPANYELSSGFGVLSATRDNVNHKLVHLTTEALPAGDPDELIVLTCKSESGVVGDPNQSFAFRSGITPIQQIQFVSSPGTNDVSPLFDEIVTVQGKITAVEGNYYYLQDAEGGQWDGLYSRIARAGDIEVGDRVQVSGRVNEFFGSTQLNYQSGVDNWVNLGPAGAVVTNTVTAAQIHYRDATKSAEPWENQLVKIVNATVDSVGGTVGPFFGEWLLRQLPDAPPADTAGCDLDGITGVSYDGCLGDRVDLTGVLRYSFSQYRIAPRTGRGGDIIVVFDSPTCAPTEVEDGTASLGMSLDQNRPNPFLGATEISLRLPVEAEVQLEVLDVAGRLVKQLAAGPLAAGEHELRWDGTNTAGKKVAAGTYFYRLRSDGREISRRLVRLN